VDTICELSPGTHRYVTVGRLACFNFHCCLFVCCGVDCELSPGTHRYVTVQIGLCVFVCVCMCVHVCVRVCVCVL